MELEDYIPQVEEFYRQKHNGRKLQWHHLMSNGIVRLLAALEVAYCHQNFLLTGILWLPRKGWGQQGQCFEFPTLFYTIIFLEENYPACMNYLCELSPKILFQLQNRRVCHEERERGI